MDRKKCTLFGLLLSFTRYFLAETKFITRQGYFTIAEDEFDLYRIIDKKRTLPFGQRLFGYGTVCITVKDADTPHKDVISIKRSRDFMALLDKQVNAMRDRYGIRGEI